MPQELCPLPGEVMGYATGCSEIIGAVAFAPNGR
jgi:hypothetical protein